MNVGKLEEILKTIDDKTMHVMLDVFNDECRYSMAQNAEVKGVQFQDDDIPKKKWPTIECLVITDSFY